jgi:3-hydroxyisobutyrate dehydrogenase
MATIGFIGLGNMGGPMAANLLKAGHAVKGYDLSADAVAGLEGAGGTAAATVGEAAAGVDAVVTMLPAGRHVKAVYLDEDGVLAHAAKGTLLIDSSTIDVATAREVATAASGAGMAMVDAPVSGGVGGAAAGTLTFMVGGPDEAFAAARPLLEAMGKTIVHAGGPGNGQAAKICNNMILGISMIGVCEAFVLAEKLGLDHQKLFDISSTASGQCWSLTTYCPVPGPVPTSPANRDYKAGFTAGMMLKDLRLAQDAAQSVGAATPLGAQAQAVYALFASAGQDGVDFSGIIKLLRGKD